MNILEMISEGSCDTVMLNIQLWSQEYIIFLNILQ